MSEQPTHEADRLVGMMADHTAELFTLVARLTDGDLRENLGPAELKLVVNATAACLMAVEALELLLASNSPATVAAVRVKVLESQEKVRKVLGDLVGKTASSN